MSISLYRAINLCDISSFSELSDDELALAAPLLVRLSLRDLPSLKEIYKKKSLFESLRISSEYLSANFSTLSELAVRETRMRRKLSEFSMPKYAYTAAQFERADAQGRLQLVLHQVLSFTSALMQHSSTELLCWELALVYRDDLLVCIYWLLHELPAHVTIAQISEIFIRVENGVEFLLQLISICPALLPELLYSFLENNFEHLQQNRNNLIKGLCDFNAVYANVIIQNLLVQQRSPDLIFKLSLAKNIRNPGYLISLLLELSRESNAWFFKSPAQPLIYDFICQSLRTSNDTDVVTDLVTIAACLDYKIDDLLVKQLAFKPPNPSSKFLSALLSTILLVPTLSSRPETVGWLQWLVKTGSISTLLALSAINSHNSSFNLLTDLVREIIGSRFVIKSVSRSLVRIVLPENVLASFCLALPPTVGLCSRTRGLLPIQCILQLARSDALTRNNLCMRQWLYSQVCQSQLDLHPNLIELIDLYISSLLHVGTSPLPPADLLQILTTKSDYQLAPQLLLLYYFFSFSAALLGTLQKRLSPYSSTMIESIPLKMLLKKAEMSSHRLGTLYPSLIKLAIAQYPHLFTVTLEAFTVKNTTDHGKNFGTDLSPAKLRHLFSQEILDISECDLAFKQLLYSTEEDLINLLDCFASILPKLLEVGVARRLIDLSSDIWFRLNDILPRRLWLRTVNALSKDIGSKYSAEDLSLDPLLVLKCDPVVFRCAPILKIVLTVLSSYLTASRAFFTTKLAFAPPLTENGPNEQEREELKNSLLAAQDSAAAQMLLEYCLEENSDEELFPGLSDLREVQVVICKHLHRMFLDNAALLKLVHFQGYPTALVPIIVAGVPSMHVCLDFIPELLNQPSNEKQIFAIHLVSHLALQFSIPKAYQIAKIAVNVCLNVLDNLPRSEISEYFLPILPSLKRLSKAFPPLAVDIVKLLIKVVQVTVAMITVQFPHYNQKWLTENLSIVQSSDVELLHEAKNVFKELSSTCFVTPLL